MPDVSSLVKKTDYDAKISENEKNLINSDNDKYITTSEYNKLKTENFSARLARANLLTKTDFDAKLTNLNKKTSSNKTKHLFVDKE